MRYVDVCGVRISAIGLGTWQFGAREWGYGNEYAESIAPAIVTRALELGINRIDTAEMYGFGRSERIVGRAIKVHSRDSVFRATKVFPVLGALGEVASAHDATSAQVALAWLIRRPNVVIPGASSVAQVEANAAASELELSDDEDRQLSKAGDRFSPRVGRAATGRILRRMIRARPPSS